MTSNKKDPVLVVLQLSGGNDYLNTVIPYTDPLYWDARPGVKIPESDIIDLDGKLGLHPSMQVIKDIYDQGNAAIIHGVGYSNSIRSHFRSMDIWHTCEPDRVGTEGWLGLAAKDIDPNKENVVTTVSIGPSMFRAVSLPGVPVACVDSLDSYGLLTGISDTQRRNTILDRFTQMYSPAIGTGLAMEYLGETGLEAMAGAAKPGASGGMVTKLAAARIAMAAGCNVAIAKGSVMRPLSAVADGARCTWFRPLANPQTARKQWIAGSLVPAGKITIDDGAAGALAGGKSLLPAGVTGVDGTFERGDAVALVSADGCEIGRGLVAYSAADARLIMGHKTSEIEGLLGYRGRDAMIHRDDLVLD